MFKVFDKVELSAVGVFNRDDFSFNLYRLTLEHFQIESQNWENSGRRIDEKLIELTIEQNKQQSR